MVSLNQIKAGVGDYIESVMMPRLDSKRKFLAGAAYVLIAAKMDQILPALAEVPAVKMLDLVDADGNVDVDALYNAAKAQMQRQESLEISIKTLGDFKFRANDIDELYRFIMNGGTNA